MTPIDDAAIAAVLVRLVDARADGATICPSEAARVRDPDDWRRRMPDVRRVAAGLATEGILVGPFTADDIERGVKPRRKLFRRG